MTTEQLLQIQRCRGPLGGDRQRALGAAVVALNVALLGFTIGNSG